MSNENGEMWVMEGEPSKQWRMKTENSEIVWTEYSEDQKPTGREWRGKKEDEETVWQKEYFEGSPTGKVVEVHYKDGKAVEIVEYNYEDDVYSAFIIMFVVVFIIIAAVFFI